MASARIAAGLVKAAATAKHAEIDAKVERWRADQIAKVQLETKAEGPFWARRYSVRTPAEAEAEYDRRASCSDTEEFWDSFGRPARGLEKSRSIVAAATAALTSGDGYVTLDADEVRFLGLEGK